MTVAGTSDSNGVGKWANNNQTLVDHLELSIVSRAVWWIAAKEIQLQHRAAVTAMAVVDRAMQLLGSALGGQLSGVKEPDMSGGHQVVICSEQQIKVR